MGLLVHTTRQTISQSAKDTSFGPEIGLRLLRRHKLHQRGVFTKQRLDDLPHRLKYKRRTNKQHLADALGINVEHELDEEANERNVCVRGAAPRATRWAVRARLCGAELAAATHPNPRRSNTVSTVWARPSACICDSASSMRYTHSRSVSCDRRSAAKQPGRTRHAPPARGYPRGSAQP